MDITVAVITALVIGAVVGVMWGVLIERDAQVRFGAPRPLPHAVIHRRLDITEAQRRSSR